MGVGENSKIKVHLVGDINIDFTLIGILKVPDLNKDLGMETRVGDISYTVGGSGFNFIKAISGFGLEVDFYAKVGKDFYGNYIRDYLKRENIGNSLIVDYKVKTGICTVIPIKDDRILLTFNGGNEKINISDIDLEELEYSTHVHLSSYYLLKGLQPKILSILKFLKSSGITTSFDTGFDPDENWQGDKIFSILKYIDVFIPNEVEALNITNKRSVDDALNLLSNYCPTVIIKMGPEGLVGKERDNLKEKNVICMPPYDIDVVDTTCCGDCFDAGFVYSYLKGFSFKKSLLFANACGALQATKIGSYRFKGIKEIEDFMDKNKLKGDLKSRPITL